MRFFPLMRRFVPEQGAYRDDDGKPVVLDCVRKAEKLIAGNEFMEYLPMGGSKQFNELSVKLAYGDDNQVIKDNLVASVQTLSGTGTVGGGRGGGLGCVPASNCVCCCGGCCPMWLISALQ